MKPELPKEFEERMRWMLGEEFDAFLESYQKPRQYGLRINPLKVTARELEEASSFHLRPIMWTEDGYYYEKEDDPARHPFYDAGLYYLQEPSAMTPASRLPVSPGDRVLDLCAAPGGKATALGAALRGQGVLVANDVSGARAKALLKNLELFGIANAFVTNELPGKLAEVFPDYFDKILVDAPCSGEGMFRKDPAVIGTWSPQRTEYFAKIQRDLLKTAVKMLRPGGLLLYSTCTFAPIENEGSISWLLENDPRMRLCPIAGYEGFAPGSPDWGDGNPTLSNCVRIWPHRMEGEGHFLALLQKGNPISAGEAAVRDAKQAVQKREKGSCGEDPWNQPREKGSCGEDPWNQPREKRSCGEDPRNQPREKESCGEGSWDQSREKRSCGEAQWGRSRENIRGAKRSGRKNERSEKARRVGAEAKSLDQNLDLVRAFFAGCAWQPKWEQVEIRRGNVYQTPPLLEGLGGIHFLRNGLFLGEIKKERFEPSQQLAMTLNSHLYSGVLSLSPKDERVAGYLRGEPVSVKKGEATRENGWILLCVDNFSLGWGKLVNGVLKNKYWGGWRKK